MGKITLPTLPKGYILPLHTPVSLPPRNATRKTPMVSWNPGIPVPNTFVTPEEADLFRAKSITLLRESQLNCPVERWIQSIQNTPIVQVVKEGDSEGTVTLQQMLPIHQGVLVEISFQRKGLHSVPLQESFHLSERPPAAHPLPREHTGWALGEELFTLADPLAKDKVHFITQLAQNAFFEARTEQIMFHKQNAFQQCSKRLLEHHRMLAYALESASQIPSPPGVIDTYFNSLDEKAGWNHLTHLYEAVNALVRKEVKRGVTKEAQEDTQSKKTLSSLSNHYPAEQYTRWVVQLLRQGAENPNSRFGKQLQEIYAFQLTHFLQEQRATDTPAQIAEHMVAAIKKEIAILTSRIALEHSEASF